MKRAVWFLGVTCFAFATGCVGEQTTATPYEYRIPLTDNSQGEEAARACATSCEGMDPEHESAFFDCLQTCPDARIYQGASCTGGPADQPPASYCFTRYVAEVRDDAATNQTNELVASVFARIAAAGIAALLHSRHGEEGGHEHAAHAEHSGHRHHR